MPSIQHARAMQVECAKKLQDGWDTFTALGLHDWFAEEFLIEQENALQSKVVEVK